MKSILARFDDQERNDAWVKRLRRYRRGWFMLSVAAVGLILVLEIQQNFEVNPAIFIFVAGLAVLNFVLFEAVDSRIEAYHSDKLFNRMSEEERKERFAKIGFEPERLNSNE